MDQFIEIPYSSFGDGDLDKQLDYQHINRVVNVRDVFKGGDETLDTTNNISSCTSSSSVATGKKQIIIDKPPEPYADMITKAIMSSPDQSLQLKEIYDYIEKNYEEFSSQTNGIKWRNAVRHNLSSHKYFVKTAEKNAKGHFWSFHPAYVDMLRDALFDGRQLKTLKIGSKFKRAPKKKIVENAKSSTPSKSYDETKKKAQTKSCKKPSSQQQEFQPVETFQYNQAYLDGMPQASNVQNYRSEFQTTAYYESVMNQSVNTINGMVYPNHNSQFCHQGESYLQDESSLASSTSSPCQNTPLYEYNSHQQQLYNHHHSGIRLDSPYSNTWSSSASLSSNNSYNDSAYLSSNENLDSPAAYNQHYHQASSMTSLQMINNELQSYNMYNAHQRDNQSPQMINYLFNRA